MMPFSKSLKEKTPTTQDRVSITKFWMCCLEREIPLQPQGWAKVIREVVKEKRKINHSNWEHFFVHDAACGTGKVMDELHKQGIPVSGSDLSMLMLKEATHTNSLATEAGESPRLFQMPWDKLADYFNEQEKKFGKSKPNILIVPGASIPYANAWDANPKNNDPKVREQAIRNALTSFKESIIPGGVLLLTTTSDESFTRIKKHGNEVDEYELDFENQGKAHVREEITHDPKTKTRIWKTNITFSDGNIQTIERNAFMITRSELMKMLKEIGFIKVKKINIPGEVGHYDGIIAETPRASN